MASKGAIGRIRLQAITDLEVAMTQIGDMVGVEAVMLKKRVGRDPAYQEARQLERLAVWAQSVADALPDAFAAATTKAVTDALAKATAQAAPEASEDTPPAKPATKRRTSRRKKASDDDNADGDA
jgi:hypothetical protein